MLVLVVPLLVVPLLGLAWLAPPPVQSAERQFTDPEFGFSATAPAGMREATLDERISALNAPDPDQARNRLRSEVDPGTLTHNHVWLDEFGTYRRSIMLVLLDTSPFMSPQQFIEAMSSPDRPLLAQAPLPPPLGPAAHMVESTFEGIDGFEVRQRALFLMDFSTEPGGAALIKMQALNGDWAIVEKDFNDFIQSIKWEGRIARPPNMPQPGAKPVANEAVIGAAGGSNESMDADAWGELEVLGTLILTALLVAGMVAGGRGPA